MLHEVKIVLKKRRLTQYFGGYESTLYSTSTALHYTFEPTVFLSSSATWSHPSLCWSTVCTAQFSSWL